MLRLAWPLIVVQLGQVGMNTVDTIMVGPLGPDALAAVGVASALFIICMLVCTGTIVGMTPIVSQAYGRGDLRRCNEVLVQGLWLAAILSLPVAWVVARGEPILVALGQDPRVAALAGGYLGALAWSLPPHFLFMTLRQYLEGMGVARPSMVITLFGLGLNVVANRAFIYGVGDVIPPMGVVGTGWATTLVRWAMLGAMVAYLVGWRARGRGATGRVALRPDRRLLATIVGIGIPIGIQMGLEVGVFSLAAVMIGWLGPVELAAHQIAINLASTTFMVALGTSMAGAILVGQHIGGGRVRAMRGAVVATYLLAVGFMGVCAFLFLALPEELIRLYSPDAEVIRVGAQLLFFAALFQIFDGAQVAGVSVLRGAADTRVPMAVCMLGYWLIGLPIAYALAFTLGFGAPGMWAGLSIGLAAVAVLLTLRVRRVLWSRAGVVAVGVRGAARGGAEPGGAA